MAVVKTETLEGGLVIEDLKIGDGYEVKPGGTAVGAGARVSRDASIIASTCFGSPRVASAAMALIRWLAGSG